MHGDRGGFVGTDCDRRGFSINTFDRRLQRERDRRVLTMFLNVLDLLQAHKTMFSEIRPVLIAPRLAQREAESQHVLMLPHRVLCERWEQSHNETPAT